MAEPEDPVIFGIQVQTYETRHAAHSFPGLSITLRFSAIRPVSIYFHVLKRVSNVTGNYLYQ